MWMMIHSIFSLSMWLCCVAYAQEGGNRVVMQSAGSAHQGEETKGSGRVADHEDNPLPIETARSLWQYGTYLDLSYIVNFNFPENHLFRSRGTTPRTNELAPDMGLAYIRKDSATDSRWGMEFGMQGGYDTETAFFGQDRPVLNGADTLRHFAYSNVSYLAPIGNGLTIQGGLFDSIIGYESLYAAKNPNYTRSWLADNSPYKMFGLLLRYPVRDDVLFGFGALNGYWHLAHPNDQPSYLAHVSWQASERLRVIQNLYYGPDQRSTSLRFWRFFSNSMVEFKHRDTTLALSYDLGTEQLLDRSDHPRTLWTGAALFVRHTIAGPWSVAVRPELYWDEDGRQTGFAQFVQAITTTLEYKITAPYSTGLLRLEYRYDRSTGREGGFFKGAEIAPGVIGLTPDQHLLIFAMMWNFDSR
jgi:hypothetical protein